MANSFLFGFNISVVTSNQGKYMQVSFKPYMLNNKGKMQSPSFKGTIVDLGVINPLKIAQDSWEAGNCAHRIWGGGYKPTLENLKSLIGALDIANQDKASRLGIIAELDDTIDIFVQKARKDNVLDNIIKDAKEQRISSELVEKAKKYNIDIGFLLNS